MNTDAAQLIASHLPTGLPHPGNPAENRPPTLIPLPGFRTAGMPDDMAKAVTATAQLIGEAIINLLETDGHYELVDASQAQQRRTTIAGMENTIIRCRQCGNLLIALTGDVTATTFINAVTQLNPDCATRHQPKAP